MGEKVSSRHWPVPVLVTFMAALSLVGSEQAPSPLVRATTVAALVTAFALTVWLRRRERRAYEARLADLAAARAVAEDRLALSRELHDLVSGGLGAITVHAAVAQRLHRDPEGLRQALAQIEQAGHEATADLRRMLAVLRGGDAEARQAAPPPAPCGAAPAEDLALRVVREALVNTARHAGPSPVRVEADTGPGRLSLRVSDAGPGPDWVPQPGSGYGLTGLREQAQALGGSLTAGPVGDGFTVVLELPARAEDVCGPAPGLRRPGAPAREDAGGEDAGPARGSQPGRERADAGGRAGAGTPRPGGEAGS